MPPHSRTQTQTNPQPNMHTTHNPSSITRNLAEKHTFSSKERDTETGLSYFGARYYSSDLSIWLSVDPMSGKYPSLSPYTYCANNPVKLVDPNGEEVWIIGEQFEAAFNSLQKGTNLQLSINNGVLSIVGGEVLNDNDKQLLEAINSRDVKATINTGLQFEAGVYGGTTYDGNNNTAESTNNVNIYKLIALEKPGTEGSGMMHEITEGYNLGRYVVDTRKNTIPSNASELVLETKIMGGGEYERKQVVETPINPNLYNIWKTEGHNKATKAPNEMSRKESQRYKFPNP